MNSLYTTYTENGMATPASSGSALVDMFYRMGAVRSTSDDEIANLFLAAYLDDALVARKLVFHNRNIRGGQGERRSFRIFLHTWASVAPETLSANIHLIPHYGRWDDLFALYGTALEQEAISFIATALRNHDSLAAKWMPREGKRGFKEYAVPLIKHMRLSYSEWRTLLVACSNTVEQLMSANVWEHIEYEHVPSKAMLKYRNAFARHSADAYTAYIDAVKRGEKTIHAKTLYPHEIVREILRGNHSDQFELQWNALPNYVSSGMRFLPVVDVSGSMEGEPMEVSIALGLYLAERNTSVFHNTFITFETHPSVVKVSGDLRSRVLATKEAEWGGSTNIKEVFSLVLRQAIEHRVPQSAMPTHIIILSDMQFDQADHNNTYNPRAVSLIHQMYEAHNYTAPKLIFWNLRNSKGVPAYHDESGTVLLSGFSPSAMETVLSTGDVNPYQVMLDTLSKYDDVV